MYAKLLRFALVMCVLGVAALPQTGCSKQTPVVDVDPTPPPRDTEPDPEPGPVTPPPPAVDPDAWKAEVQDIFFDFDKYELRSDARMRLQQNARLLKENTGFRMMLEGHCDERGTDEYNLALGQRRADAVRAYLVDLGVSSSRLSTVSYGEEQPFSLGHTEEAWSKNRRVHFKFQ